MNRTPRQGIARTIVVTRPDGIEVEYRSQSDAAKVEPIFQTDLSSLCRGYKDSVKGYKARFKDPAYEDPETKPYRETGI